MNKALTNRGIDKIYTDSDFEKLLNSGKKLRMYFGVDPSGPIIHLGHAVVLKKMAEFQKMGHTVILLIGDFTGMIGDPTDRNAARQPLTREEVLENAKTYKEQAKKFLNFEGENPAELRYNSQWNDVLNFKDIIELSANFTVGQLLERDMFQKRISEQKPISLHEFLYPLVQGYDAVMLDADIQIGGTDQTFNMLAGRHLSKALKNKTNIVITCPLLEGTDGRKMSKSYNNFVGVEDTPFDMYGKIMSIIDDLIIKYFDLLTDISDEEIRDIKKKIESGENPRDYKAKLATEIVKMLHSQEEANEASAEFDRIFKEKQKPTEIEDFIFAGSMNIIDLLLESGLVSSKSEGRRIVEQNGLKIDDALITDIKTELSASGQVLQLGKRKFIKLKNN
jgi:tyrosyl-tRNA synthetase